MCDEGCPVVTVRFVRQYSWFPPGSVTNLVISHTIVNVALTLLLCYMLYGCARCQHLCGKLKREVVLDGRSSVVRLMTYNEAVFEGKVANFKPDYVAVVYA